MNKRRAEFAVLAALLLLAAGGAPSVELRPTLHGVGDFAPPRIDTVRDLGVVALKLVIDWID